MKMMNFPKDAQVRAIIAELGKKEGILDKAMDEAGTLILGVLEEIIVKEDMDHAYKIFRERGLDATLMSLAPIIVKVKGADRQETCNLRGVFQIAGLLMQKAQAIRLAKLHKLADDGQVEVAVDPQILALIYSLANPYAEGLKETCCIFDLILLYVEDEYAIANLPFDRKAFEADIEGMATWLSFSDALETLRFLVSNHTNMRVSECIMRSMVGPDKAAEIMENLREGADKGPSMTVVKIDNDGVSPIEEKGPTTVH